MSSFPPLSSIAFSQPSPTTVTVTPTTPTTKKRRRRAGHVYSSYPSSYLSEENKKITQKQTKSDKNRQKQTKSTPQNATSMVDSTQNHFFFFLASTQARRAIRPPVSFLETAPTRPPHLWPTNTEERQPTTPPPCWDTLNGVTTILKY